MKMNSVSTVNHSVAETTTDEATVTFRVTYGEVDQMGVAYYGHYLRWFEMGRAEYLRCRGKTYKDIESDGIFLPVIEACVYYRHSAEYDDQVEVRTMPKSIGRVKVAFAYQVIRTSDGTLLAEGHTIHACTGKTGRPRRFPNELLEQIQTGASQRV